MKTKLNNLSFFLVLFFFLGGCDKEDLIDNLPSMTAEIDGIEWKSVTRITKMEDEAIVITGTSLSGEIILITVFGSSEGIYELSILPVKTQCSAVYKQSANTSIEDVYISSRGYIEIVEITEENKISGIFEFSVIKDLSGEKIEITNGRFKNLLFLN